MKTKRPFSIRILIENILSTILIIIALYLIVTPFVPQIGLWWAQSTDKTQGYVYATNHPNAPKEVKNNVNNDSNKIEVKPIPKDNRVVIPTIHVDAPIVEGPDANMLNYGSWRRPKTSTPDKGGNTVLTGHRFLYGPTNAMSFYNMDKVKVGDAIIVYWQGKEYDYDVAEIKEVPPTAVEVEDPTPDARITIYTCTPLWTAKDRLVVIAKPVSE